MRAPLRVILLTTGVDDLPHPLSHVIWLENSRVLAAGARNQILSRFARSSLGTANGRAQCSWSGPNVPTLLPQKRLRSRKGRGPNLARGLSATSPGPPLIILRDINVHYGNTTVLHNLNWTVREHESWALLGPNGSGKTTVLSLIVGDHPQAYANDITVFGRRRGSGETIWDIKRHIGSVSPELNLHFNRSATCFEVVGSGFHDTIGLFLPLSRRQRGGVRRQLSAFGLLSVADVPLYGLSAGTQRMALLARALVKKPRLLLLDEPCQGLDSTHRDTFIRTVDKLIRSGNVTVLYVTHRADEIPRCITNVLRLRKRKNSLD